MLILVSYQTYCAFLCNRFAAPSTGIPLMLNVDSCELSGILLVLDVDSCELSDTLLDVARVSY